MIYDEPTKPGLRKEPAVTMTKGFSDQINSGSAMNRIGNLTSYTALLEKRIAELSKLLENK